jgi:hypothetical protein
MARPLTGSESLHLAQTLSAIATSADELRVAQAVMLPLQFGLTLQQTATLLGRSTSWVASNRSRFIREAALSAKTERKAHGGRRNQVLKLEDELRFMLDIAKQVAEIHRYWRQGNHNRKYKYDDVFVPTVVRVKTAMAERAGRPVSIATAYNLMARTGRLQFPEYKAWMWTSHISNLI